MNTVMQITRDKTQKTEYIVAKVDQVADTHYAIQIEPAY